MNISEEDRLNKNKRIAESRSLTAQKRSEQTPLTIEFKVNRSRLNLVQKECLKMIFVEAKWCKNWLLNQMNDNNLDIFKIDQKTLKTITHRDKDGNDIEVTLQYLGSSLKDEIIKTLKSNIKTLHTNKKQNRKAGRMKFVSDYTSINLKQYGTTHKFTTENYNKIQIQGIKKPLPVSGGKQLKKLNKLGIDYEFSSGIISHRDDDIFIRVLVWVNKEQYLAYKENKYSKTIVHKQAGIDFGCQTSFTTSYGEKVNAFVEESEHLRRLQKKLSRQEKGSNNRYRTRKKIRKEYYKLTCLKNEKANKIVSQWLKTIGEIIIQDEQLNAWKKQHGKKVQHSVLGRVKQHLIGKPSVHVLNRWIPTSKLCTVCGHIHSELKLQDRQFVCPNCCTSEDRDIHAAKNMVWIYNHINIGVDGSEYTREEFLALLAELFPQATNKR